MFVGVRHGWCVVRISSLVSREPTLESVDLTIC
jgi:hypothetical protein